MNKVDQILADATEAINSMARCKMAMNSHKGDIVDMDPLKIIESMRAEVKELEEAIIDGQLINIIEEAADVQNFLLAAVSQAIVNYRSRK